MRLPFRWTLRRQVAAEMREWETENAELRLHRLRWSHRWITSLSARLPFFTRQMLGGFGLLYFVAWLWASTGGLADGDKVDYFSALWGIQTTSLALVYPLVISFVAILTQRRPGTAALVIYLHDSGALLAGLSALLLVGVMGVQYLLLPYVSSAQLAAWLGLDAIWFLFNLLLTFHFVAATFDFIQPDRRSSIIHRYTIANALPELTRRIMAHAFFQNAVALQQLPGPSYEGTGREMSWSLGLHGFESGRAVVTIQFGHRRRMLVNVHYWLLAWALRRWKAAHDKHQARPSPEATDRHSPVVYLSVDPLDPISGQRVVCRADHVVSPPWYVPWLIRFSLQFGWDPEHARASCETVLHDIAQEALAAMRGDDVQAYEGEIRRWRELYVSLIRATSVRTIDNGMANVTEASLGWFSGVYDQWLKSWYLVVDHAAKQLGDGRDYLTDLMPIPRLVLRHTRRHATVGMQARFLRLSHDLWTQLLSARARHHAAQALSAEGALVAALARGPNDDLYQRTLYDFVGEWEQTPRGLAPPKKKRAAPTQLDAAARLQIEHLSLTVTMLFDSAERADRPGAEWMTDVLLKWVSTTSSSWEELKGDGALALTSFLNIDSLIAASSSRAGAPAGDHWAKAWEHAWIDFCLFAAASLTAWSKHAGGAAPLMRELVAHLAKGKPLRAGGGSGVRSPFPSLDQVVSAWCRQHLSDSAYRERMTEFAESLRHRRRPRMVAGRVYSSHGRATVDYEVGVLLIMMVQTRQIQGVLASAIRCYERLGPQRDAHLPDFLYRLNQWLTVLKDAQWESWRDVYEDLRVHLPEARPFEEARTALTDDIEAALRELEARQAADLVSRPLSRATLDEISRWAATTAFDAATAASPIPLFRVATAEFGLEGAEEFSSRLAHPRNSLVEPPMAEMYDGAGAMFAQVLRSHVAGRVAGKAWSKLAPTVVHTPTEASYWAQLRKFEAWAQDQGMRPLLLIENPTRPRWMWDLAHEVERRAPEGIRIHRDPTFRLEGYKWHVNTLPVVDAPLERDTSLLAVRESLREVVFERFPSGRLVECDTEEHPEDASMVVLVFRWRMRVSVVANRARRLNHPESPESD